MLPISAMSPAMSAFGLTPRVDIVPSEGLPMPGIEQTKPAGDSFASMLGQMVQDVNAKQVGAADTVNALQSGGDVSLHQAVIAMEEANVSFQLMVEVRNKLLESYQELMRMQI